MEKRNLRIIGIILVSMLFITGISYALWQIALQQESTNIVNTACFKINFKDQNEINLLESYPISDEEGMSLTPYSFTVENICNTTAFYQINLEELESELKKLSKEYVKVSVNQSNGKLLNTYAEVDKTLENATTSHRITSGSLKEGEKKTYELRLWLDENTPATSEVMNATFQSKVTIIAVQKEDLENEFTEENKSLNEDFSNKEETIEFKARSKDYNIIEVSEDNVIYNPLENPSKEVTISKTYTIEGTYTMYFKDEVGNIIESTAATTMLDQTDPVAKMKVEVLQNKINVVNESTDNKSGISKIEYKIEEEEWKEGSSTTSYIRPPGTYNISIRVTDRVGNSNTAAEMVTIEEDVIIYNLGKSNYLYDNVSEGTAESYAQFNADHIFFPNAYNKIVFFKNMFKNKHRYLKISALTTKNGAIGGYYYTSFGISKNLNYSNGIPSSIITQNVIISYADSNRLKDYPNYTIFTLDLENIKESYYVFLHNCDTIFQVQKVWLTNSIN